MFKSGFETPPPQSQLTASSSPRVLVFSALGRHGVGSIRLAWEHLLQQAGTWGQLPTASGAAPHEACPGPCGRDSLGKADRKEEYVRGGKRLSEQRTI